MKRLFALILIILVSLSCSNELEFNESAIQGLKNYDSWEAKRFHAVFTDDGGVKIVGVNNNESLILNINGISEGMYTLNTTGNNFALFEDKDFIEYSTLNNGDGEIIIEEYNSKDSTITGSFKFNSYAANGDLVNFIQGLFYKTPIESMVSELSGSNSFSASVNSVLNEIEEVETYILDGELKIIANYLDGTFIEFFVPENIQVGSYTLNASTQIYANYVFGEGTVASSQYGTLTILEHDSQFKRIKASFLFNTGNPHGIVVSNGNFIIYY